MSPFNSPMLLVLCGKTGSGKSKLLSQLELLGFPLLNLENLASHRGSAFGNLLLPAQPSQKDFEIQLEREFSRYSTSPYIFIEQKPSSLGKRKIPLWLYSKMEAGVLIQLDVDKKLRVDNILSEYKPAGEKSFMDALHKLNERLPAIELQKLENSLRAGDYKEFIDGLLNYYDQGVNYQLSSEPTLVIPFDPMNILDCMPAFLYSLRKAGILVLREIVL